MKKTNLVKRIVCMVLAMVTCFGVLAATAPNASAATANGAYVAGFPLGYKSGGYNVTVLSRYSNGTEHPSYLYNKSYGPLKSKTLDSNTLLDIDTDVGAKVYAVQTGTVITNKKGSYNDYYVVVKHADNTYAYYGHLLNTSSWKTGSTINAGSVVGTVSQNSHLHFEWSGHDPYCEFANKGLVHTYSGSCGAKAYPHKHSVAVGAAANNKQTCTSHNYSGGICTKCGHEWKITVTAMKATTYKVTKSASSPVWNRPYSTNSKEVYRLQKGSIVTVVGKTVNNAGNTWYLLSTGHWIYSGNVTKASASNLRYVKGTDGTLNMRATANGKIVGSIPEGAVVIVNTSKTSGKWIWVTYNGVSGYVYKTYLTTSCPPVNK